jgi:exonuclease III
MKWGAAAGAVIASYLLYFFPNDSTLPPTKFCPTGWGYQNLSTIHQQSTLTVTTFNAEWLFDGIDDSHRSFETADDHIREIGEWIADVNSDVLNIVELEDCQVLQRVRNHMSRKQKKAFISMAYATSSFDTATRQTVGLISKVPFFTPDGSPGITQSYDRASFPADDSTCQYNVQSKKKTSGVSKHWYGIMNVKEPIGEILVIGAHLKARPNQPKSCSKREAQSKVLAKIVQQHGNNRHVILMGDLNDFDNDVKDVSSSKPRSNVLKTLKKSLSLQTVWKYVPKKERWSYSDDTNKYPNSTLDYILISKNLTSYIESVWVDRNHTHSDHRPLSVRFRFFNE